MVTFRYYENICFNIIYFCFEQNLYIRNKLLVKRNWEKSDYQYEQIDNLVKQFFIDRESFLNKHMFANTFLLVCIYEHNVVIITFEYYLPPEILALKIHRISISFIISFPIVTVSITRPFTTFMIRDRWSKMTFIRYRTLNISVCAFLTYSWNRASRIFS